MLEIDRSDNSHAMSYRRIRDFESFSADELNKMQNPARMKCQLLERVAKEGLRHGSAEVSKAH
jgi:hypothetical protein